ncbi:C-X-C chemokine receptor type 2 [Folsomia candida]|uniref:C-X-C chemokine receptor type 2 n=1 Tax=Folsomia candida TaxID=158441 RepID=A0A226DBT1_FOLCA|nr:C-X-C chemokine receptor type 2 [Folsomia candida]
MANSNSTLEQLNSTTSNSTAVEGNINLTFLEYLVIIFCLICVAINIFIIFYTSHNSHSRHRVRRLNTLIANLSLVCVFTCVQGTFLLTDKDRSIKGDFLCPAVFFMRIFSVHLISSSILSISHERLRLLKVTRRKLSLLKLLGLVWAIPFVCSLPSAFNNVYNAERKICQRDMLFNSRVATVIHEVSKCLLFHVFISMYMIFEMFKLRSKTKDLRRFKDHQTWKLYKRVQSMRFVYATSATFILFWLPFGIAMSYYRIVRKPLSEFKSNATRTYVLIFVAFIFILILPIVIFWTNERPKKRGELRVIKFMRKQQRKRDKKNVSTNAVVSDSSGFTTFACSNIVVAMECGTEIEVKITTKRPRSASMPNISIEFTGNAGIHREMDSSVKKGIILEW